jgi:hypothetical protein
LIEQCAPNAKANLLLEQHLLNKRASSASAMHKISANQSRHHRPVVDMKLLLPGPPRAVPAVFAVFAGNYQRQAALHAQKSSILAGAAHKKTAGEKPITERCTKIIILP